jgi:hypothetical protein
LAELATDFGEFFVALIIVAGEGMGDCIHSSFVPLTEGLNSEGHESVASFCAASIWTKA